VYQLNRRRYGALPQPGAQRIGLETGHHQQSIPVPNRGADAVKLIVRNTPTSDRQQPFGPDVAVASQAGPTARGQDDEGETAEVVRCLHVTLLSLDAAWG
jgi:hypothetical protein